MARLRFTGRFGRLRDPGPRRGDRGIAAEGAIDGGGEGERRRTGFLLRAEGAGRQAQQGDQGDAQGGERGSHQRASCPDVPSRSASSAAGVVRERT